MQLYQRIDGVDEIYNKHIVVTVWMDVDSFRNHLNTLRMVSGQVAQCWCTSSKKVFLYSLQKIFMSLYEYQSIFYFYTIIVLYPRRQSKPVTRVC